MTMTTKSQSQEVLDILYNSTFIQNMNKGKIESPTGEFFGTTNQQGMAYPRDSLYNKPNTFDYGTALEKISNSFYGSINDYGKDKKNFDLKLLPYSLMCLME